MSKLLYQQLYKAYFAARRNKRTKPEQIRFEVNYETEITQLYQDIIQRNYAPLPSKVFVTRKPVDREIFAPRFRDRVVHHLIYQYIYKHLDQKFIYDSYSCRVGKGTLFGIERAKGFLRKATANYTQDAYVLKLDINGYFMNINRNLLWQKIEQYLDYSALNITQTEQDVLHYLIRQVVLHDVSTSARRCSPPSYWARIPASKSLFCTAETCGLPIGSLTSQLFSNVYLNDIDHKIKAHFKYYGRYVDDLLLVDRDREKLLDIIPQINTWLAEMQLKLHPKKIYFQHYTKGFYFLGQYIKPYRAYISKRIKKHIYQFIKEIEAYSTAIKQGQVWLTVADLERIENRLNSYFGILCKAHTYRYVHHIVSCVPQQIAQYMSFTFIPSQNQMKATLHPELKMMYSQLQIQ